MKNINYIFVDDGYPEAADYDNNYIGYDPQIPDSYKRAMDEARRRRVPVASAVKAVQPCAQRGCSESGVRGISGVWKRRAAACCRAVCGRERQANF